MQFPLEEQIVSELGILKEEETTEKWLFKIIMIFLNFLRLQSWVTNIASCSRRGAVQLDVLFSVIHKYSFIIEHLWISTIYRKCIALDFYALNALVSDAKFVLVNLNI